ncbi:hypothetical protein [Pseudomonas iridis]|uniref:hypothetical protein n=1 Tax=Pseudomonas iridis TaxID=2710587 RepID=UPI001B31AAC9|nr:hypothetical protein [Pseudomonas iridis]MBP5971049.1 hypothetical protein [Pseudomonas iridis]
MTEPPALSPLKLARALSVALAYLVVTLVLLRAVSPPLVSSDSSAMVCVGLLLPILWFMASACLALYLFNKNRRSAAPLMEKNPQ